jgi:hypothetical protein
MFQFIAKLNDNDVAKTIRGKIDTDDAGEAAAKGVAQLSATLKASEIDPSSVTAVIVKRMGGSSGFKITEAKPRAKVADEKPRHVAKKGRK